jgi:pimeloyl-ACP methyl ester carboxylesterase
MTRPPIVLLHGANSAAAEMEPLAEVLRAYGVVHAPNLIGHGGRDIPTDITMHDMAADVAGWMGRQGLARAVIVGYSLGATLALHLARHFAPQVIGACALAPKYVFDARTVQHWVHLVQPERLGRTGNPRTAQLVRIHAPRDWVAVAEANRRHFEALGNRPPLSDEDLRAIGVPVLLISSDRDPIVPWKEVLALGKLIPGSRVAMFYGAAHPLTAVPVLAVARVLGPWIREVAEPEPGT